MIIEAFSNRMLKYSTVLNNGISQDIHRQNTLSTEDWFEFVKSAKDYVHYCEYKIGDF